MALIFNDVDMLEKRKDIVVLRLNVEKCIQERTYMPFWPHSGLLQFIWHILKCGIEIGSLIVFQCLKGVSILNPAEQNLMLVDGSSLQKYISFEKTQMLQKKIHGMYDRFALNYETNIVEA